MLESFTEKRIFSDCSKAMRIFKNKMNIKPLLCGATLVALFVMVETQAVYAQSEPAPDGAVSAIGAPVAPIVINNDPPPASPVEELPRPPETMPSPAEEAAEVTEAPPEPSEAELSQTVPVPAANTAPNSMTSLPDAAQGDVKGTNVMGDGGVQEKHSGTYYDSDALIPDADLAKAGAVGPRKVDPALEPGQKYIVVEKGPRASSTEAQYVAATRALKLGRYAAAMEIFENLYKKNHKDPRILMGLAVSQQGAGFNESAAQTYEDLLKVQPNNADAIVNLMGLMRQQYPSVTLNKLSELRSKYPTNPGIPAQIGMVNAEMKNYDEAVRYLEVAASMDPRNSSHVYNMAIVRDRDGKVSEAIKLYERALQMDASYGNNANSLPREEIYDRLVVLRRKV